MSSNILIPTIFLFMTLANLFLGILDLRKKRVAKFKPTISFLVPCYNSQDSIENTLANLFKSYDRKKIDLIVIDDCSTDNTSQVITRLSKKYPLKMLKNKKNLGKTKSINAAIKYAKGELIGILDSEVIITDKVIKEAIARLSDEKVGAVSCRCKIIKDNFLSHMCGMEYNVLAIYNFANNIRTSLVLWGGCAIYKKEALLQIKGFKENMITEDVDSALRLAENGWKVEQCFNPMLVSSPKTVKSFFEQRIRWSSGGVQCFIKHPKLYLYNPLLLFSLISYSALIVSLFIDLKTYPFLNISYLTSVLLSLLLSSQYLLIDMEKLSDASDFFYLIFFAFVYYPVLIILNVFGGLKGIYLYFKLKEGQVAWRHGD